MLDLQYGKASHIRLVDFNAWLEDPDRVPQWISLSHCWGNQPLITTAQATLSERLSGAPLDRLSMTFQEAVQIARAVKVRCLWIDALGIAQDDPAEWEQEAAIMADTYGNATFTIAAVSSHDGNGGCFSPITDAYIEPTFVLVESSKPQQSSIYMRPEINYERTVGLFLTAEPSQSLYVHRRYPTVVTSPYLY